MQDMASSSNDTWLLSLNMEELQAVASKARSGNARVLRVPLYIRDLKPHRYDPLILPMGMNNRDFRQKSPTDQLKLAVRSVFLGHLKVDRNGWKNFCTEVALAQAQVSGPAAPRLEHFYQDHVRPPFLTPELEVSILIVDAFFIVAMLIWANQTNPDSLWYPTPPPLFQHLQQIFNRGDVHCNNYVFIHDILWMYEAQVTLPLVENVWVKVAEAIGAPKLSGSFGFGGMITYCLSDRLLQSGLPYKGDEKIELRGCEHLLASLHRALCTGTRPSDPTKNGSTASNRATLPAASYLRKTGIRFKGDQTNIGGIRFVKSFSGLRATLILPKMVFTDYSETKLLNLCAYECMNIGIATPGFTSFVLFMDELIDSEEDVDLLSHADDPVILGHYLGDTKHLVSLFSNMLQNFPIPVDSEEMVRVRTEITTWYNKPWRRQLVGFLDRFERAPWLAVSLIAAMFVIALGIVQTIYTVMGYYNQH